MNGTNEAGSDDARPQQAATVRAAGWRPHARILTPTSAGCQTEVGAMAVEIAALLTLTRPTSAVSLTAVSADSGATLPANGVPGSAGAILELVRTGRATTRGDLVSVTGLAARPSRSESTRSWPTGCSCLEVTARRRVAVHRARWRSTATPGWSSRETSAPCTPGGRHRSGREGPLPADGGDPGRGGVPNGSFRGWRARSTPPRGSRAGCGSAARRRRRSAGSCGFATGRPVTPPIMPGWHLYPVRTATGRTVRCLPWSTTT